MKSLAFCLMVALLVVVICGDEDVQGNFYGFVHEAAKRGKAQIKANPYFACPNRLTGAPCICNRLYRKNSPKHQTVCLGSY